MCKETKDLAELLEGYETDLCNKIFRYQLNHKIDIDIVFYPENFCHLLGIQHIYGKEKKYLGVNGYNRIKNKEISRIDLKKHALTVVQQRSFMQYKEVRRSVIRLQQNSTQ